MPKRSEESIMVIHGHTYEKIKKEITSLNSAAEIDMKGDISPVAKKAIGDVLDYLRTLEGELKASCKDYFSICESVLNDRLVSVGQVIEAIQTSIKEKTDTYIICCYSLQINSRISYGWISVSNLKSFLESTIRQIKEGMIKVTVPPDQVCELSAEKLKDPVVLPSGNICNRSTILECFRNFGNEDPYTREDLRKEDLISISLNKNKQSTNLASNVASYFNRRKITDSNSATNEIPKIYLDRKSENSSLEPNTI